jgi:hypothetical protein
MGGPVTTITATVRALLAAAIIVGGLIALAGAHPAAAAGRTAPRTFSCTGSLGEAFTARTVTGSLSAADVPSNVVVTQTASGVVESTLTGKATSLGASWLHAGYTQWDVTGANPDGNLYVLNLPPVLPGRGGLFDADLDIEFAGGANGGWQIPMFDCTVSGGPAELANADVSRAFACSGSLGEAFTLRSVTGTITSSQALRRVTVSEPGTGVVDSYRATPRKLGVSPLHPGFVQYAITGANPNGDLFFLHLPPTLPGKGGFFDAELQIDFAGGANGGWQIPMFDCAVS